MTDQANQTESDAEPQPQPRNTEDHTGTNYAPRLAQAEPRVIDRRQFNDFALI